MALLLVIVVFLTTCGTMQTPSATTDAAPSAVPAVIQASRSHTPTLKPAQTRSPIPRKEDDDLRFARQATAAAVVDESGSPDPVPLLSPTHNPQRIPTELPVLDPSGTVELHDLILFRSPPWQASPFPFYPQSDADDLMTISGLTRFGSMGYASLWGISPDRQRAGRLSPDGYDFDLHLPSGGMPQFLAYGYNLNHPFIQLVTLPEICNQLWASEPTRCDKVQFSTDGHYLGFRYGENNCGRYLRLIDRLTGETVLDTENPNVHDFRFLANGKVLVHRGHCEGSSSSFFDPLTSQWLHGGETGGGQVWGKSLDGSLLVSMSSNFIGSYSKIWGYRLDSNTIFHPERAENKRKEYDKPVVYLPDGRRFLYQHLTYGDAGEGMMMEFDIPAQIVRYDPFLGERIVLAADPAYHYLLREDPELHTIQWYGDWIRVVRLPFKAQTITYYEWADGIGQQNCLFVEMPCPPEAEVLALNGETGALRSWDPSALPQPKPTPTPGPDLDSSPIYIDPNGEFTFYIGLDGKSLWKAPTEGLPVLWVTEGEGFVYVP